MALLKLQKSFKETLTQPEVPYFLQQIKANPLEAEARFNIYKNNIQTSYLEILEASYPLIQALIGEACMKAISLSYLHGSFPQISFFNEWPSAFSKFIASLPTLKELPYLEAVAQFEWLSLRAIQSAYEVALTPIVFSTKIAEHMAAGNDFKIALHPSCFLMESPYPLEPIFKIAKGGAADYELVERPGYYLIFRDEGSVKSKVLSAAEFVFLNNLQGQKTFDFSLQQAFLKESTLEVEGLFTFLLQAKLICSIN